MHWELQPQRAQSLGTKTQMILIRPMSVVKDGAKRTSDSVELSSSIYNSRRITVDSRVHATRTMWGFSSNLSPCDYMFIEAPHSANNLADCSASLSSLLGRPWERRVGETAGNVRHAYPSRHTLAGGTFPILPLSPPWAPIVHDRRSALQKVGPNCQRTTDDGSRFLVWMLLTMVLVALTSACRQVRMLGLCGRHLKTKLNTSFEVFFAVKDECSRLLTFILNFCVLAPFLKRVWPSVQDVVFSIKHPAELWLRHQLEDSWRYISL